MAAPLLSFLASGFASGAGTSFFKDWLTKKETAVSSYTYSPSSQDIHHAPYESYAPMQQYAPQVGYSYVGPTYQINSPSAVSKKQASLKQISEPEQTGVWDLPQEYKFSPTPGGTPQIKSTNIVTIAVIAGVAIVAYGMVRKK